MSGDQCEACAEGASCPGSGALQVLPGFYSTASDSTSIAKDFCCIGGCEELIGIGDVENLGKQIEMQLKKNRLDVILMLQYESDQAIFRHH